MTRSMDPSNPYLAWQQMENYFSSYLFENPSLPQEVKNRIKHFQYQYLLKVSNICIDDAIRFGQNVSFWSSPYRGDYHRFYHLNPLLGAIEKALQIKDEECDVFLLCDGNRFKDYLSSTQASTCRLFFLEGQDVCLVPRKDNRSEWLREFIVERGLTPTLQQAAETAAQLSIPQENLNHEFPKQNPPELTLKSFLENPLFLKFKKWGENFFSASILAALLEGFKNIELDNIFERKRIHSLLGDSYGRILRFLEESMRIDLSLYENWPKFESCLDLAHEEIFFWLMIAEPYSDKDLKTAIKKTIPFPALLKILSTGMAAFSEVLHVLLAPDQNVLLYDGIYFENRAALLKTHPSKNISLVRFPDYLASLKANLKSLKDQNKTIDLLFVNFHENILKGRYKSEENDIGAILAQILQSGCASPSLTIVIDVTIGFLNSKELQDLLKRFKNEIQNRQLHIIILWSHQKFDLFGFDKGSAGSYAIYSSDPSFIKKFRTQGPGNIDCVSRQCLAHYFVTAPQKLEERRARIFANTAYVNRRIAKKLKFNGKNGEQPILAVVKNDLQNFSIDVQCDRDLERSVCEAFAKRGIPLMVRSSFGFNLTTVASTRFNTLRFSIGLEEKPFLDRFVAAFNEIFENHLVSY